MAKASAGGRMANETRTKDRASSFQSLKLASEMKVGHGVCNSEGTIADLLNAPLWKEGQARGSGYFPFLSVSSPDPSHSYSIGSEEPSTKGSVAAHMTQLPVTPLNFPVHAALIVAPFPGDQLSVNQSLSASNSQLLRLRLGCWLGRSCRNTTLS